MTIRRILLVLIFSAFTLGASAQDELFKVLASSGDNKVTSDGSTSKVTIGRKLHPSDKIQLAANGYLGLVHKSGKTIELKKAGIYSMSQLAREVDAQNLGVCKKYVDFVVGEMTSQEEDISKNKYKYMAVTGSVERPAKPVIQSFLPKDAKVLIEEIELSWLPLDGEKSYNVVLTNLFQDTVFSKSVNTNSVKVDLTKLDLSADKIYKWSVEGNSGNTEFNPRVIRAVELNEQKTIIEEINGVKQELKEENALNKFILATVYADKGLLIEAIANYEKAIRLAPAVDSYKIAYGQFLESKELAKAKE